MRTVSPLGAVLASPVELHRSVFRRGRHLRSATMTYLLLALAIVFEVGWATAMKASNGFSRPIPAAITIVAYLLSLVFLTLAVRKLDISVAYAIWAGLGAAIIAALGILYFREPINPLKAASLVLIVLGIVGLRFSGAPA